MKMLIRIKDLKFFCTHGNVLFAPLQNLAGFPEHDHRALPNVDTLTHCGKK